MISSGNLCKYYQLMITDLLAVSLLEEGEVERQLSWNSTLCKSNTKQIDFLRAENLLLPAFKHLHIRIV